MAGCFNVSIAKLEEGKAYGVTWLDVEANSEDYFDAEAPDFGQGEVPGSASFPVGQKALAIGHSLFNFLDGDAGHFTRALERAGSEPEPLNLGITTCAEARDWPLELVAYKNEFLVRNKVLLLRTVSHSITETEPQNRPLKLLFMAGSPMETKPLLDYEKEEEAVFKITGNLAVDLEVEDSGTLEGLAERLLHERYDVVHLSGHADIDKNGMPYFILEDETGRARPVSCDLLWKEALIENPPRLLFLSGCRTGEAQVVSFARVMVESFQIPMVLGWGRPVQDGQASLAAEFIYRELCRGRSLPHAVQRARYELMERFREEPAWPLLRLYARGNRPGPLVAKGQKVKPKPRALKHTYLTHSRVKVLVEGFVGRRRQLQQCARVLKEKMKTGLLIQGTGGLGKSCLAGKVCERFSHHHLIVVHGVLNDISLHKALEKALNVTCDTEGLGILEAKAEMKDKLKTLCATSFKNKNYFIILDDFEQNLEPVSGGGPDRLTVSAVELLKVLLTYLPLSGNETQVMITCRYGFSLTEQGEDLVKQRLELVTLTGFLQGERLKKVRELRHIYAYPDAGTQWELLAAGCGNPRLMEWLDVLVGQMGEAEVPVLLEAVKDKREEFIREHVIRELTAKGGDDMPAFLSALSIYRIPVQKKGVLHIGVALGKTEVETETCLERGVGLSLVERDEGSGVFGVTPLLRREWAAAVAEEKKEALHRAAFGYFKEVCEALDKEDKFETGLVEEWVYHALACGEEEVASQWGGRLVTSLGDSLAFAESRRVGEWVLAEKKQPLANKFDAVLLNETGSTFWNMGDNRKGIEYYEQALKIDRAVSGNEHPNVAIRLNNLGTVYFKQGKMEKAKEVLQKAYDIFNRVYGPEHPHTKVVAGWLEKIN